VRLPDDTHEFPFPKARFDDGSLDACQDHPMGWQQWIRTVEIAPGIAARDAVWREREVEALMRAGCRIIHLDSRTGDAQRAVSTLRPLMRKYEGIIDLHAGTEDFDALAGVGADSVTFDASAVDDVSAAIEALRRSIDQVGVAFGPDFEPTWVATVAAGADLILCAYSGEAAVERVRRLAGLLPAGVALQLEGDVSQDNVRALYGAGANVLIADKPIFEREDLPRAYRRLVQALA
jgi:pentose-5-phosphate-3-epimerase